MSDQCCPGDPECRRKQPILLRPAPFEPGRYYLLTRYTRRPQSDGPDVIRASEKHALDDGSAAVLNRWREVYEARPDAATLREQIWGAVDHVLIARKSPPGPRKITDAVMAVLAERGLVGREERGDG